MTELKLAKKQARELREKYVRKGFLRPLGKGEQVKCPLFEMAMLRGLHLNRTITIDGRKMKRGHRLCNKCIFPTCADD